MLFPARNKKGEVFLPLLAIFTWLILGVALITMIIGVMDLDKKTVATSALSLSDTDLRAEIAKINLERMKEYSYCKSVKALAENQDLGTIGENPTCYWSENYLLGEFEKTFTENYKKYLNSENLNHRQGSQEVGKLKWGYSFNGKEYLFTGEYGYLADRLKTSASDDGKLEAKTEYKQNDYDRVSETLPTFKKDKLNFISVGPPRIDLYADPYFTYSTGYSLEEYLEMLKKIQSNKECIASKPDCNLGNNWKYSKTGDNSYSFEITSTECKPFGNIIYKFSINLNTIEEALERWGDKDLKPICGKKAMPLF